MSANHSKHVTGQWSILRTFSCYLQGIPDILESVVKTMLDLQMYTSIFFAKSVKQTTLDKYFLKL
jgi:hypothetical protein